MTALFQSVKNSVYKLSHTEQRQLLNSQLWQLFRVSPAEFGAFLSTRATRGSSLSVVNNLERDPNAQAARECAEFKAAFPKKSAMYTGDLTGYDLPGLIAEIKKSTFLTQNDNLGLAWCLEQYRKVMDGFYRDFNKPTTQPPKQEYERHNYDPKLLKETNIDDIEF